MGHDPIKPCPCTHFLKYFETPGRQKQICQDGSQTCQLLLKTTNQKRALLTQLASDAKEGQGHGEEQHRISEDEPRKEWSKMQVHCLGRHQVRCSVEPDSGAKRTRVR